MLGCGRVGFDDDAGDAADSSIDAEASIPDSQLPDTQIADTISGDPVQIDVPSEAGVPPTGCTNDHAARLFCDGFESGDLSAWDTTSVDDDGEVTLVNAPVYRGNFALRATGPSVAAGRFNAKVQTPVFSLSASGDQWFRAYVFLTAASDQVELFEFTDANERTTLVIYHETATPNVHSHGWGADEVNVTATQPFPLMQWVCIELHTRIGTTDGAVELFVDGTSVLQAGGLPTARPEGLTSIGVGVRWQSNGAARVVHYDEVVADTTRIGCD